AGLGVAWTCQLVPFHASASSAVLPPDVSALPAAVPAAGELQDPPLSPEPGDPAGRGTDWTLQLAPFHPAASGTLAWELSMSLPTAVQAVGVAHDTARSSLPSDPAGLGTAWMLQLVPFHRSASD